MSLVGISHFNEEIFQLDVTLPENTLKTPDNSKFRIISFYQCDVDGLCAQYVLQLHSNFKSFASLHSFPVYEENDIYQYIHKTLSLHLKRPDVQADAFMRVLLIGIRGWSSELLRAIKVHFEHLLDPPLRKYLKIAILTVIRPIGFFGKLPQECILFKESDDEPMYPSSGIYTCESASVTSLLLKGMTFVYENEHAAAIFAASISIFSKNVHFGIGETLYYGKIEEFHNQISQLNGGPYVSYDIDKAILPLVTFTTLEDALSISPSILVLDSKKNPETIAEFRIQCSLRKEEFTSEFNALSSEKQKRVLSLIKRQISFYREMPQLCWLRRVKHIPNLDVMYFLSTILNKEETQSIIALDFLYNILQERLQQDSYYDRNVINTISKSAIAYINQSFDSISRAKLKFKTFLGQKLIIAEIRPNNPLSHINQLEMVASIISNIEAKGDEVKRSRCLLIVEHKEKYLFGFTPNVDSSFPDIWPGVFMQISQSDSSCSFNALLPNVLKYKGDVRDIKKSLFTKLANRLGRKR
ncbi:conserved Plasmodium protein, unknown function [Babesia microti strain RI]|uniref:Uncharacterized protein n=1 Tax=Babesia microti (strain RI) TaxID=1133968 RepID=A0A1R4ABD1_BABMR|nr:conserved Plasmodium protein, unknown function [Babesia microti strain RI]SJK86317.1 conserved Plasmodium protein, unknown function [Babesia microti strain RI]|eukprot:XP_021338489.1 conserved Plasmodium protein, unknown function [Babesia microti strain RI]